VHRLEQGVDLPEGDEHGERHEQRQRERPAPRRPPDEEGERPPKGYPAKSRGDVAKKLVEGSRRKGRDESIPPFLPPDKGPD
jgi:hypothetical protein